MRSLSLAIESVLLKLALYSLFNMCFLNHVLIQNDLDLVHLQK